MSSPGPPTHKNLAQMVAEGKVSKRVIGFYWVNVIELRVPSLVLAVRRTCENWRKPYCEDSEDE